MRRDYRSGVSVTGPGVAAHPARGGRRPRRASAQPSVDACRDGDRRCSLSRSVATVDFVEAVEERLLAVGFDRLEPPVSEPEPLMYYRTSHEWTKLGWVVTIVNLVRVASQPARRELENLSVASWSACRTAADRFSSRPDYLLAYTVLFAAVSPEAEEFLEGYRPKHWKATEFPCRHRPADGRAPFQSSISSMGSGLPRRAGSHRR